MTWLWVKTPVDPLRMNRFLYVRDVNQNHGLVGGAMTSFNLGPTRPSSLPGYGRLLSSSPAPPPPRLPSASPIPPANDQCPFRYRTSGDGSNGPDGSKDGPEMLTVFQRVESL